ncbi:MAG: DUF1080 domain-containing protein [Thermoguttaceae bacterium]|nr:DUF1080 domain-containing protein [Thermoguttaceae bacterium]
MKKTLLLTALVAFVAIMAFAAQTNAQDPEPKTVTEKIELFNGKDLSGWYVFMKGCKKGEDPDHVFTVHDGMIHVSGNGLGGITSNEAFKNYRMIVEFKWGEKTWGRRVKRTRDSGLLFHSVGKDGAHGGIWMYSIEANIIEGGVGDFIVVGDRTDKFSLTAEVAPEKSKKNAYIWQKGGKPVTVNGGRVDWFNRDPEWEDVINFRGKNDVEKPHGQWNTLEIVADGDKVDVYVNGTLVNQAINVKPCGGRIQLQTEMAEIFYRRVTLLPLKK